MPKEAHRSWYFLLNKPFNPIDQYLSEELIIHQQCWKHCWEDIWPRKCTVEGHERFAHPASCTASKDPHSPSILVLSLYQGSHRPPNASCMSLLSILFCCKSQCHFCFRAWNVVFSYFHLAACLSSWSLLRGHHLRERAVITGSNGASTITRDFQLH